MQEAKIHYNKGEYDLSADKLSAAIRADPQLPGPYRNLGLTYQAMGKFDLAVINYRKYLQLAPSGKYSARIQQEIASCVAKLGQPQVTQIPIGAANVVIHASESGAQILVDGVMRGATPSLPIPVQPGKHVVTLYKSGFLPWTRSVEVSEGQTAVLDAKVERDPAAPVRETPATAPAPSGPPGRLRLIGVTSRADVSIDGVQVPLGEDGEVSVSPGDHRIQVGGRGLAPWSGRFTAREEETTTVTPVLELTRTSRVLRRSAWVAVAAAVALGAAGVVVGFVENGVYNDIRQYDRSKGSRSDLDHLLDRRQTLALGADFLYGFAAVALATGVVLFAVAPEPPAPRAEGGRF
jgi:hypothetical protein